MTDTAENSKNKKDIRDANRSISRGGRTPPEDAAERLHVDKLDHGAAGGEEAEPDAKSETEKVRDRAGDRGS